MLFPEGEKNRPYQESPLFRLLLIAGLFCVAVLVKGYMSYRVDHLSQIPLFMIQHDPTLFARDWFFSSYSPFFERFFHLSLIQALSSVFGVPGGLFVGYFLCLALMFWAWANISRLLFSSSYPAIIAALFAISYYDYELGGNHVIEQILIPRTEALVPVFWALYFMLRRRFVVAALLAALAAYFQMAVGLFFGIPMALWMLLPWRMKNFGAAAAFLGLLIALVVPQGFLVSKEMLDVAAFSAQEEVLLFAYIRHPHHMVPHLWGVNWIAFASSFGLFLLVWSGLKSRCRQAWSLGLLTLIIAGLLAIATVFIEFFPSKFIIEVQPYRLAVLMNFVIYLILSFHVFQLLQQRDCISNYRGFALIAAGMDWHMLLCVTIAEVFFVVAERRNRIVPGNAALGLIVLSIAASLLWQHEARKFFFVAFLLTALLQGLRKTYFFHRPKIVAGSLAGGVLLCALFFSSFFWLPYQQWMEQSSGKSRLRLAELCWKFQVNPIPVKAIERIGEWARTHTPKDSLFIIPPERTREGFGIWSQRAIVFCMKYIPHNPQGLAMWKERYLAVRGVLSDSPEGKSKMKEALEDFGGKSIGDDYRNLTAGQMLQLARRYGADYAVTSADYPAPAFEKIHEDLDYTRKERKKKILHLYRLHLQ